MMNLKTYYLRDDGIYPNNPELPLIVMKNAVNLPDDSASAAAELERIFRNNNWTNPWRNGIFDYHHYHSNTHEVLGVCTGSARVQFGGSAGVELELSTGDVAILPAGTAHKKISSDRFFFVVGAYPEGSSYDMNRGEKGERPAADEYIKQVPGPQCGPVFGKESPLLELW